MLVKNNHSRLMRIAIEIGCFRIFLSINFPVNAFRMKISKKRIKRGSAGTDKSAGVFGMNSDNKTEKGTRNITPKNVSFKSCKTYHKNIRLNGTITDK